MSNGDGNQPGPETLPSSVIELEEHQVQRTQPADESNEEHPEHPRRRRRPPAFVKRMQPTLVLENSGSVARDHLACERTFLAYMRTSLTIAATGVALVQLFTIASNTSSNVTTFSPTSARVQRYARPIGAATIFAGLFVLAIGVTRYFTIQHALTVGNFPVARVVIAAIAFILGALVLVVFLILVAVKH